MPNAQAPGNPVPVQPQNNPAHPQSGPAQSQNSSMGFYPPAQDRTQNQAQFQPGPAPGGYFQPSGASRFTNAPYIPKKKTAWPYYTAGAILLLLLVLFGLNAAGILKLGGKAPSDLAVGSQTPNPNLKVPGSQVDPSLVASASLPVPQVKIPAEAPPQMPKDVFDWLKHLQRCESVKQQLTSSQEMKLETVLAQVKGAGGLTSAADVDRMTDPDTSLQQAPGSDLINGVTKQMQADWLALTQRFDSWPPPAECKPIAAAYDTGLNEIQASTADIVKILNDINTTSPDLTGDIQKAIKSEKDISANHKAGVDDQFTQTDNLVQQICSKYSVSKWFSIDSHGGSGSIFSQAGF